MIGLGLFQELRLKTCLLTQDAVMSLAKDKSSNKSGQQQDLLKAVTENLQELTDIVSEVACFPYVWCDFQLVGGERLVERVKFCILEIQENLENFADKKETAIGVSSTKYNLFIHSISFHFLVPRCRQDASKTREPGGHG